MLGQPRFALVPQLRAVVSGAAEHLGSTSGKKDAEDSYEGVLCAGGRLATYASLASILQAASKALESTKTKPVLTHKCMN